MELAKYNYAVKLGAEIIILNEINDEYIVLSESDSAQLLKFNFESQKSSVVVQELIDRGVILKSEKGNLKIPSVETVKGIDLYE